MLRHMMTGHSKADELQHRSHTEQSNGQYSYEIKYTDKTERIIRVRSAGVTWTSE